MPIRDQNVAGNARFARHVAATFLTLAFRGPGQEDWPFWAAPFPCTIIRADVMVRDPITASNTNYWRFQIRNFTAGNNLRTTNRTTATSGGAAITVTNAYSLSIDQNLNVAANDILGLRASGIGDSATTLANLGVRIVYVPRRAGPQGTNSVFLTHNDSVSVG